MSPEETALNFTLLAFVISQVTLSHDIDIQNVGYCGVEFAKRYAGLWPSTKWKRWCCLGKSMCHLQFHIRYLFNSGIAFTRLNSEHQSEGLSLCREKGQVPPGAGQGIPLVESRVAIAINTSIDSGLPYFSMATLTDSPKLCLDGFEGSQAWNDMKLSLCGEFTGIAIFQRAIYCLLLEWNKRWNSVLDSFERNVKVRV